MDIQVRTLVRSGRQADACRLLGVRWDVEPGSLPSLIWNDERLSADAIEQMTAADRAAVDPLRLLHAFPTRRDGTLRANTTRFLAKYRAHAESMPSRRLVLIAWTPGTASFWERPEDRGSNVLTIGLTLRSTYRPKNLLPDSAWRAVRDPSTD